MNASLATGLRTTLAIALATTLLGPESLAQRGSTPASVQRTLDVPQKNLRTATFPASPRAVQRQTGRRPAIMLTGYWPPTNEAVRRFSDDPVQNPLGWIGLDWEGRGYDVYSYFPEFSPPTCTSCGQGSGDFEVDYQDTSADFWAIANALEPIAIITLSRTNAQFSWEVEHNMYNRDTWGADYSAPTQPTPNPPDTNAPALYFRPTALPAQAIVDDVDAAALGLNAFICFSNNAGTFVSGFIAYHGVWYQAIHDQPEDPNWCIAAGHVHVGRSIDWGTAQSALEVTLRTVIGYVDTVLAAPPAEYPSLCRGDGGDGMGCNDCPCSNDAPAGTVGGCLNSNSTSTRLHASGDPSVSLPSGATTDLRFAVTGAPPTAFCVLSSGDAIAPINPAHACFGLDAGIPSALFDGLRCVVTNTLRHGGRPANSSGEVGTTTVPWGGESIPVLGIAATYGFVSGQTRYFQVAHRDDETMVCGRGLNTSQAIRVEFTP